MEKLMKFSIRKTSLGVASLAIASLFVAQAEAQEISTMPSETIQTETVTTEVSLSASTTADNQSQPLLNAAAAEPTLDHVIINEADSKDDQGGADWAELYNPTDEDKDITGYYIFDDNDREIGVETFPFPEKTILKAKDFLVIEEGKHFTFGLGKEDSVRLFDSLGKLVSDLKWTGGHAKGSYGYPQDGVGEITDITSTKGNSNNPETLKPNLKINEVDSQPSDWIELKNFGTVDLDISGYEVRDDSDDHRFKLAENTIVKANDFFIIDKNLEGLYYDNVTNQYKPAKFDIGLGGSDMVRLYDTLGNLIDQIQWTEHASYNGDASKATIGLVPGGDVSPQLLVPTPGQDNKVHAPNVWINEVESNDPNDGPDWVEFYNATDQIINLKGLTLKDNDDNHAYTFEDFEIAANSFKTITENIFEFGLGKTDSVRLFNGNELIQEVSWSGEHATVTFGRTEDGQYKNTSKATPDAANEFPSLVTNPWNGPENVEIFDETATFLEDSSGLDFHNGSLYAVDNGTGTIWKLDMNDKQELTLAEGWKDGKRVRFQKDAENPAAKGPDSEGITVNNEGMVYIAVERDNSAKDVNFNVILKVDPNEAGPDLISLNEWDLTDKLPQVSANTGIEAVEFVESVNLVNKLFDINTKALYTPESYKNSDSDGIFFVALEDNGHVYGFNLNKDGSINLVADIATGIGGAMALDFEKETETLWVSTDNGYEGVLTQIKFNESGTPTLSHVAKPKGLVTDNHEGFAIASAEFAIDGLKPAFWFTDGVNEKALKVGKIASAGVPVTEEPVEGPDTDPVTDPNITPEIPGNSQVADDQIQLDDDDQELKDNQSELIEVKDNTVTLVKDPTRTKVLKRTTAKELPQTGEDSWIFNAAATSILLGLSLLPVIKHKHS